MKRNISLIGMAGVGKSFTAKRLANHLGYEYVELDKLISEEASRIGVRKEFLADDKFLSLEEKSMLSVKDKADAVIDTGGSIIYLPKAMKILREISFVVYLFDSPENIKKRFDERGEPHLIGMSKKMTFEKLLTNRISLYEKYADFKIKVSDNKDDLLSMIMGNYNK
jgi:shikimate kinase